jgi:Na+/proline symporter
VNICFKLLGQRWKNHVNDKTLGILIFTISILAMIGYFCWLFLTPEDIVILGKPLSEWALIVPVIIIVYAFLLIVAWIGWAMASTPPPLPLTEKSPEEEETEKEE